MHLSFLNGYSLDATDGDDDWCFTATFVHTVGSKWGKVKDETTFRYAHAEIRTRVVVICGPTRYC